MAINTGNYKKDYSLPAIFNFSFDPVLQTLVFQQVGYDGTTNPQRPIGQSMATKITEDGLMTYIAIAAPGTAQSSALWQCKKIDETTGIVITWADGDSEFDNVATDLTALTYS